MVTLVEWVVLSRPCGWVGGLGSGGQADRSDAFHKTNKTIQERTRLEIGQEGEVRVGLLLVRRGQLRLAPRQHVPEHLKKNM